MYRLFCSLRQNSGVLFYLCLGIICSYLVTPYISGNNCLAGSFSFDRLTKHLIYNFPAQNELDDYEPHLNVAGKPQKAKKVPHNLVRPRYYSSELGIREKILIGVLSSEKTIRSLAVAINKTSAHFVPKILFFLDSDGAEKATVINLKLSGIIGFVDARDILKPFHMLKYLTDNFLEEYDYFFLTRDTTYIDAKRLVDFVKHISVSEEVHAGGATVDPESQFCSLDAGILLSNSILQKVQGSLDWCVKNAFLDSDNDNVGRCILHASRQPCLQNIHGSTFTSVSFPSKALLTEDINKIDGRTRAITYHKLTDPNLFYKLHLLLTQQKLKHTNQYLENLKKSTDTDGIGLAWPPGSYAPKIPRDRFDLLRWDYFTLEHMYFPSDFSNIQPLNGAHLLDIQMVVNNSVQWLLEKYGGELCCSKFVNGYRRFDPSRGLDYILDYAFKDRSGKEVLKRVEAFKRLGKVELLPVPYVTENARLTLILPVTTLNKIQSIDFLKLFSQTFVHSTELINLMLILLYEPDVPGKGHEADVYKEVKHLAQSLSSKHHKELNKIAWISIKVPSIPEHGVPIQDDLLYFAITDLVSKKLSADSLVLFCEPTMEIKIDYLNRVRMNTIIGRQVYCPIPFTEYDPEITYTSVSKRANIEIHKNTGHFDVMNMRHISFYLSDYLEARGKVSSYLPVVKADRGIGKLFSTYDKESKKSPDKILVDSLYALMVQAAGAGSSDMGVIRAPEPGLRLRHNTHLCALSSNIVHPSAKYCERWMFANTATRSQLASHIIEFKTMMGGA